MFPRTEVSSSEKRYAVIAMPTKNNKEKFGQAYTDELIFKNLLISVMIGRQSKDFFRYACLTKRV